MTHPTTHTLTGRTVKDYRLQECIGQGSFGAVLKSVNVRTNEVVAVKVINMKQEEMGSLMKEIQVLGELQHPSITKFYEAFICDSTWVCIVMEFLGGGSLRDLLDKAGSGLGEAVTAVIVREMLQALAYLHRSRKIHRDIKAGNVLLSLDGHGKVKVADFGVSAQLQDTMGKAQTFVGSPFWIAPEIVSRQLYDSACDIWSLGITVIELLCQFPPRYEITSQSALLHDIVHKRPPELPVTFSSNARDFVSRCLQKNPNLRPSAEELMNHPFVASAGPLSLIATLQRSLGYAVPTVTEEVPMAVEPSTPPAASYVSSSPAPSTPPSGPSPIPARAAVPRGGALSSLQVNTPSASAAPDAGMLVLWTSAIEATRERERRSATPRAGALDSLAALEDLLQRTERSCPGLTRDLLLELVGRSLKNIDHFPKLQKVVNAVLPSSSTPSSSSASSTSSAPGASTPSSSTPTGAVSSPAHGLTPSPSVPAVPAKKFGFW